jgi:hypothetical protein
LTTPGPTDPPPPGEHQPPGPHQPAGRKTLVLGLIVGLLVGAGIVGLTWALTGDSSEGAAADAAAVCGIIERTPDPPAELRDITMEYLQRWSVSDVASSIAEADSRYRPLAEALEEVLTTMRTLEPDKMGEAIGKARSACDDL